MDFRRMLAVAALMIGAYPFGYSQRTESQVSPAYSTAESRGLHHQLIWLDDDATNSTSRATNTPIVYLEAGMHYLDEDGNYQLSDPKIESFEEGAIVRKNGTKIIFAPDINTAGAVDILTPGGDRLRGSPLGLSYFDAATGQSVMIAETRSAEAKIVSETKIVYEDFLDDVSADVVYEVRKSGITQIVVIKEDIAPPSAYGLSDKTSRLEVLTEFLNPPQPRKEARFIKREMDPARRARMVEPDLTDTTLKFAGAEMKPGVAFALNREFRVDDEIRKQPVGKTWQEIDGEGRSVLFEAVEYEPIKLDLAKLPNALRQADGRVPRKDREIPKKRLAAKEKKPIVLAALDYHPIGYAVDYVLVTTDSDISFDVGYTYVVNGWIQFENATFAAGSVVKFARNSALLIGSSVTCNGTTTNPSIFTAYDDDSYGQILPAIGTNAPSTGQPTGFYADGAISLDTVTGGRLVKHVKIRHATTAIHIDDGSQNWYYAQESSFEDCASIFYLENNPYVAASDMRYCRIQNIWDPSGVALRNETNLIENCDFGYTEVPKGTITIDASSYFPESHPWSGGSNWDPWRAIDGKHQEPGWHSGPEHQYSSSQWVRLNLNTTRQVGKVKYYPRPGTEHNPFNGTATQYRIYVTSDGSSTPSNWGSPVAEGNWSWTYGNEEQEVEFPTAEGQFVILQIVSGMNGWAAVGELWLYEVETPPQSGQLAKPRLEVTFTTDHSAATVENKRAYGTGVTVRYTTDGTDPTSLSSDVKPVLMTAGTVKARAFQSGSTSSEVASLYVGETAPVSFAPNGHSPIEYSGGPLTVQLSSEPGAVIEYEIGSGGTLVAGGHPSSVSVDGVDLGTGTIYATAYVPNKLRSINESAEYSFRVPQPTGAVEYNSGRTAGTITFTTIAGAHIRYTIDESEPTESSSLYSGPLTYSASTEIRARAYKSGYVPSGYVTAWVNQLPEPKIATADGLLEGPITVNNAIDIWLLPNLGFDNVYGEESGGLNGWTGPMQWSPESPTGDIPGSFTSTIAAGAVGVEQSINSVGMSAGRTYTIAGWFKGVGSTLAYAGFVNNEATGSDYVGPEDHNPAGRSITFLTQPLVAGETQAYLADTSIFSPVHSSWSQNLFVPFSHFSRGASFTKGNQPNTLKDIYYQINYSGHLHVTAVDPGVSVTLSAPYAGATLPIGTVIARRSTGSTFQYPLLTYYTLPNEWTYFSQTASFLRPGTERVKLLLLLSYLGGTSSVTGFEVWEGTAANRPKLHYSFGGDNNVYGYEGVSGPMKLTIEGNHEGTILLGQRGGQYIDSPLLDRTITFKTADPTLTVDESGAVPTLVASSATVGAVLYYSKDGTDPTSRSVRYSGPVPLTELGTVTKWRAFREDYDPSGIIVQASQQVAPPSVQITSNGTEEVATATADAGAEIRYTDNGDEPMLSSDLYTIPVSFSEGGTTRWKAFKIGYPPSETVTKELFRVADPVISVSESGGVATVSASTATTGAVIYYTTDGSDPEWDPNDQLPGSILYSSPVQLSIGQPTKWQAFKNDYTQSGIVSVDVLKVSDPSVIMQVEGRSVKLTATTQTPGAQIRYTIDGTEPTVNSPSYSQPVILLSPAFTRWKAFQSGHTPSETVRKDVSKHGVPLFNPDRGTFVNAQEVEITGPAGAELRVHRPLPNILDFSSWEVGTMGAYPTGPHPSRFKPIGLANENAVEIRTTPHGTLDEVWVAQNDLASDAGGGWNTTTFPVDPTKLYRFSVWLRKTGGTSGRSYLGCGASTVSWLTNSVNDTVQSNPYFFSRSDLPIDEWHLLVGYVHPAGYLGTTHHGKVYNTKGEVVFSTADFRWRASTVDSYHRSYLFYSTDSNVKQQFWNPRVEIVESVNEPLDVLFEPPQASPATVILDGLSGHRVQAQVYSTDSLPSQVVTRTYGFQVATPTISFQSDGKVAALCETAEAEIFYTLDGSEPTEGAAETHSYTHPISIASGITTRWRGFKGDEYLPSEIVSYPDVDTDYDGILDRVEEVAGTDFDESDSFLKQRLASWSFNNWLIGDQGQQPVDHQNVEIVAGFSGAAMRGSGSENAYLKFRETEASGKPNINRRHGTVRMWFRPDWSSTGISGGSGPGGEARLISLGEPTIEKTSWWAVYVNESGDQLKFASESGGGETLHFSSGIQWKKGFWYQVAITYSEDSVQLYLNGKKATLVPSLGSCGLGINDCVPSPALRAADGIHFGSDSAGQDRAFGALDRIETFNYPLPEEKVQYDYWELAKVDSDRDGLSNIEEIGYGTLPHDDDSDNDTLPDGYEVKYGYDPLKAIQLEYEINLAQQHLDRFYLGQHPHDGNQEFGDVEIHTPNPQSKDLYNIDFKVVGNSGGVAVVEGEYYGWRASLADHWNIVSEGSQYKNRSLGTPLNDAGGNLSGIKLYAAVGPYSYTGDDRLLWQSWGLTNYVTHLGGGLYVPQTVGNFIATFGYESYRTTVQAFIAAGIKIVDPITQSATWEYKLPAAEYWSLAEPFFHFRTRILSEAWTWMPAFSEGSAPSSNPFEDYLSSPTAERGFQYGYMRSAGYESPGAFPTRLVIEGLERGADYTIRVFTHLPEELQPPDNLLLSGDRIASIVSDHRVSGLKNDEGFVTSWLYEFDYRAGETPTYGEGEFLPEAYGRVVETPLIINLREGVSVQAIQMRRVPVPLPPVVNPPRVYQKNVTLTWEAVDGAVRYDIYRSGGGTSGEHRVGKTTETIFVDTSVTPGDSYSYRVVAVGRGERIRPPISKIEVVVPALDPVEDPYYGSAPAVNHIDPVEVTKNGNDTYSLHYVRILDASDAKDADGDPICFKVEKVLAGTLLIGGSAWAEDSNDLIDGRQSVEWISSENLPNHGVAVLRVSAFDGFLKSASRVTVTLFPRQKTKLLAWGSPMRGLLGDGDAIEFSRFENESEPYLIPSSVIGMEDVVQVEQPGSFISMAVRSDGTLWIWGKRITDWEEAHFGEQFLTGNFPFESEISAVPFEFQLKSEGGWVGFRDVTDISRSDYHVLAVRADGSLWSWGGNFYGELGYELKEGDYIVDNSWPTAKRPKRVHPLTGVIQAVAANGHSTALCQDGSVWWWGKYLLGNYKLNGDASEAPFEPGLTSGNLPTSIPYRIPYFDQGPKVIQIASGLALRNDGTVVEYGYSPRWEAFGGESCNNCICGSACYFLSEPQVISGLSNVKAIASDGTYALALLANGTVKHWGLLGFHLGPKFDDTLKFPEPTGIPGLKDIVRISVDDNTAMAVDKNGDVWGWGKNLHGELMKKPDLEIRVIPERLRDISSVANVFPGWRAVFANGSVGDGKPSGLKSVTRDSEVMLMWSSYPGAAYYNIKRSLDPGAGYVTVGTSTEPMYVDTGLENGVQYFYVVSAVVDDHSGGVVSTGETLDSREVMVMPRPAPRKPKWTDPALIPSCKSVMLSWEYSPIATEYEIQRAETAEGNFSVIARVRPEELPFSDRTVTANPNQTYYYYRIVAINESGRSPVSEVEFENANSQLCAAAPENFSVSKGADGREVYLSWAPVESYQVYRVKWKEVPLGRWQQKDVNIDTEADAYQVGGLKPSRKYRFNVCALANGEEGLSSETEFVPGDEVVADPSTPAGLRAVSGNGQIYLEWLEVPNVTSYFVSVYQGTNLIGGGVTYDNRYWHLGAVSGVEYAYTVMAIVEDLSNPAEQPESFESAAVTATPSMEIVANNLALNFESEAFDSLVHLYWKEPTSSVPATIPPYQFYLERKLTGQSDDAYEVLTVIGPEISFRDDEVVNGIQYDYRLTSLDLLFQKKEYVITGVKPEAGGGLSVLPPVSGNNYVELEWVPQTAIVYYEIKRATAPGGPYETIATLAGEVSSYIDQTAANGGTYYYKVAGLTQFSISIESLESVANPSPAGRPMLPRHLAYDLDPGKIRFSWDPVSGATEYQLDIDSDATDPQNFTGIANPYLEYALPTNPAVPDGTTFTVTLRAKSSASIESESVTMIVKYSEVTVHEPNAALPPEVVLLVGGSAAPVNILAPTNLVLTASVKRSDIAGVWFYDGATPLGYVSRSSQGGGAEVPVTTFEYEWNQVPMGGHTVSATAVVGAEEYNSEGITFNVKWIPELAAFQHGEADLQIPAPGMGLAAGRSYDSRRAATDVGALGSRWKANWEVAGISIEGGLAEGWRGGARDIGGNDRVYESGSHLVTVTLPSGESIHFAPGLSVVPQTWLNPETKGWENGISMTFHPYGPNDGTLTFENAHQINAITEDAYNDNDSWEGKAIKLLPYADDPEADLLGDLLPSTFTYVAPDGTVYLFHLKGDGTWKLDRMTDRNNNSITYAYEATDTESPESPCRIKNIQHSNGRTITFDYSVTGEIGVRDSISPDDGPAVIRYLLDGNGQLGGVARLVDRTAQASVYETTTYSYGMGGADNGLLTEIMAPDGVRLLLNSYDTTGGLASQTDVNGRRTEFVANTGTKTLEMVVEDGSNSAVLSTTIGHTAAGMVTSVPEPQVPGSQAVPSAPTALTYHPNGLLESETRDSGERTEYSYDRFERLTGKTDALGNTTSASYRQDGQPLVTVDARGAETSYEYYFDGNLKWVTDPAGSTLYEYYSEDAQDASKPKGRLMRETREAVGFPGKIITDYEYFEGTGDLYRVKQTAEPQTEVNKTIVTTYKYDDNGNRKEEVRQRTVNGAVEYVKTEYFYDAQNRLVRTIDPLEREAKTEYNSRGKVWRTTDALKRVTEMVYDASGNLIETIYPDGTVSRSTYDLFNRAEWVQERARPNGSNQTTGPARKSYYDGAGRVVKVERYAEVVLAKVAAVAGTDYVRYGSTPQVKMVKVGTGESLASTSFTFYDASGRVKYQVDERGKLTSYEYDVAGRRTAIRVYKDQSYANVDLTVEQNEPSTTDLSLFDQTTYGYDENGNQVWVLDANADHALLTDPDSTPHKLARTEYQYDPFNRVTDIRQPMVTGEPHRKAVHYAYDGLGNKVQSIDEAGVKTCYGYNHQGQLIKVIEDAGGAGLTTKYEYDELGNLIAQKDAMSPSRVTTFEYDKLGRRTKRTLPGGTLSETTAYTEIQSPDVNDDPNYKVSRRAVTDFKGQTITYTHDVMERLALKVIGNSEEEVVYTYQDDGQRASVNKILVGRYEGYFYDDLNRLERKETPEGILAYTYWENNLVKSIKGLRNTANEEVDAHLEYEYDQLNRLWKVTDQKIGATATTTYGYDGNGNLKSVIYPNGIRHDYGYTEQTRLKELTLRKGDETWVHGYIYGLGPSGNRVKVDELDYDNLEDPVRTVTYGYDVESVLSEVTLPKVYRLTQEKIITRATFPEVAHDSDYTYDRVGNRTLLMSNIPEVSQTSILRYDERDRVDDDNIPSSISTLFDANGNMTSSGEQYDLENRLTIKSGVSLEYDDNGNRTAIYTLGSSRHFLIDDLNPTGYAQTLLEYSGTPIDPPVRRYTIGLDLIAQSRNTGTVQSPSYETDYYGYDGHGSVRFVFDDQTDWNTQVSDTYDYDAYGILIRRQVQDSSGYLVDVSQSPGTATPNNHLYAGEYRDEALALYYLRARWYDPDLGRFTTMDTHQGVNQQPATLHKYLYAHADPVNNIDPSGMAVEPDLGRGQDVHELFYVYCITKGITRYFDAEIGAVYSGIRSRLKPDVLQKGQRRFFELKPISYRDSPINAAAAKSQINSYIGAMKSIPVRPGNSRTLVPGTIPIGVIFDPVSQQMKEVVLTPSEDTEGLIYYWLRNPPDFDWVPYLVPIGVSGASSYGNSAAAALRAISPKVVSGARAAANAARARGALVGVQTSLTRF